MRLRLWMLRAILAVRPASLGALAKRLLGIRRTTIDTGHGRYWIDPASNLGYALLANGDYEPKMRAALRVYLKPGGVFVDLGANEGYFTVQAAALAGPAGRGFAVEPQTRLLPIIAENLRLNGCAGVTVVPEAVSDRIGRAALHLCPDVNSGGSGLARTTRYRVPTETVPTVTLADIFARFGIESADLTKIDIEGYEYEAGLGSPRIFEQGKVRALALELHPLQLAARGRSPDAIHAFLKSCGYRQSPDFGGAVWLAP